jgi:hypothetical protein
MKNQGNVSPSNSHHNSTSESKENKLAQISEIEVRILLLKMTSEHKEDSNK